MITLENDVLVVRFPEIHPDAECRIEFQRTLRIPDDNRTHALPPGLGKFPLFHVDDYPSVPQDWKAHGGIFLPMHQAEAMWVRFHSRYPFAVKIAAGKINAVTGDKWTPELKGPRPISNIADLLARDDTYKGGYRADQVREKGRLWDYPTPTFGPKPGIPWMPAVKQAMTKEEQDYLSVPRQPWLDGFSVGKGKIRQFVAMPMGEGYTVEEQLTGEAVHGGLQIIVYPLKPEHYRPAPLALRGALGICASASMGETYACANASASMGLAPGGLMTQEVYEDTFGLDKWDQSTSARCFVHLLNSAQFERITGKKPPQAPLTAAEYTRWGLPWFSYYDETAVALPGSEKLSKLDSVAALGNKKGQSPLPENDPVMNPKVVPVKANPLAVREGKF